MMTIEKRNNRVIDCTIRKKKTIKTVAEKSISDHVGRIFAQMQQASMNNQMSREVQAL